MVTIARMKEFIHSFIHSFIYFNFGYDFYFLENSKKCFCIFSCFPEAQIFNTWFFKYFLLDTVTFILKLKILLAWQICYKIRNKQTNKQKTKKSKKLERFLDVSVKSFKNSSTNLLKIQYTTTTATTTNANNNDNRTNDTRRKSTDKMKLDR